VLLTFYQNPTSLDKKRKLSILISGFNYFGLQLFHIYGAHLALMSMRRTALTVHGFETSTRKHQLLKEQKMKKILIAVDKTKGSKSIMSVLKNQMRAPQEVILVHVQRIFGKSLMGDMLGEAEMSTLRESLVGTDHQEALDAELNKSCPII
jgi:hypothetical protein